MYHSILIIVDWSSTLSPLYMREGSKSPSPEHQSLQEVQLEFKIGSPDYKTQGPSHPRPSLELSPTIWPKVVW